MRSLYTLCFLMLLSGFAANAQQTVNHHCDFTSGQQNMWGPSFSAFSINQTITLFDQSWSESGSTGNGGIVSILGQSFGAAMSAGTSGRIGSEFKLSGFTTGTVEVDYPVDVLVEMPTDDTYDQGDWVAVQTSYTVDTDYELETNYPSVGEATLDLYFQMAFNASLTLCAFGCTTFDIIPPISTPTITLNIFTANAAGIWYLGPACVGPPLPASPGSVFPYALPPAGDPSCFGATIPWQVRQDFLPLEIPDNDYGIGGELTLPYVITDDNLVADDLYATGDSTYVHLSLEIFKLLGAFVPPPVGPVLANLSNDFPLPFGANIYYNVMSASFNAYITNKQRFDFRPKVYGKYEFPVPVAYNVMDGAATISSGTSAIVNLEVGQTLNYKFPCYYETVDITPTYTVQGQFSNRTYDSVSFDFQFSAMSFGFNLPQITITPEITIPEICIPYGYPCGFISWCSGAWCTPSFTIPAVVFPGFSFNIGPLVDLTLPIGSFQYDWFNQTWDLEGFQAISHPPFYMDARKFGATASHIDVLCKEGTNGAIDVTMVNGSAPFNYAWTNGANTQDLVNLPAGNYQVTVTDANGCETFTGATITQPALALSLDATATDKFCNSGVNNGSIDLSVLGGTSPYLFNWSNGATTEDISGLNTGVYNVTATDANGCTAALARTISEPSMLSQIAASGDVNCFGGSNGTINLSPSGGVMPYTYLWSNGATTEDLSGLSAGTYTAQITDLKGCTSLQAYTITQPATAPSLSLAMNTVSCYGGSDASINLSPAGGTPGYQFQWSDGNNVIIPAISEDLSGISAGTYNVTMSDSKGCTTSGSIAVTQPAAPIGHSPILTHLDCNGIPTGAIDPQISGGTAPYTYSWSNGNTGASVSGLSAGTHTLTLTDNRGCSEIYSYQLTEPNAPIAISLSVTDVDCFGNASGSVNSVVNGGTTPYTYSWSSGQNGSSTGNTIAGNYTLTLTDSKGCTETASATVNEPAAPLNATSVITAVNCFGGSNGNVDVTTTGGTAPYTYDWNAGNNQVMTEISEDISNKPADTYTVEIIDANGCNFILSSAISQPAAGLSMSALMDDVNCFAGNDGALDASVSGGTAPYVYSWSNGGNTQDLSGITAGNYTLTVTDQNACSLSSTYEVIQPQSALNTIITPERILCFGDASGSAQAAVSGGTAPYSYLWNNGQTTSLIENMTAGVYTLTVTDNKGCTSFSGTNIQQPAAALAVTSVITDASCFTYKDGSILLNVNGGTQPYYFSWSDENQVVLNNPGELLENLVASDYLVKVWDENGCKVEQLLTVGQPAPFTTSLSATDALCNGSADGTISMDVAGGTVPYSYNWNNGASTEDLSGVTAGNYSVMVTDDQGCIVSNEIYVGEPGAIVALISVDELSCINQADAAITVKPGGGTQPYTYSWSNGSTSQNLSGLVAGSYTLTITDIQNCSMDFTAIVQESNEECVDPVNTFTPNGDNYNDTWVIENLNLYPNAMVKVFNKWGNLVYESNGNYTPWDGKSNGKPLPSETYFFIIDLYNDQSNQYTGSITIIR